MFARFCSQQEKHTKKNKKQNGKMLRNMKSSIKQQKHEQESYPKCCNYQPHDKFRLQKIAKMMEQYMYGSKTLEEMEIGKRKYSIIHTLHTVYTYYIYIDIISNSMQVTCKCMQMWDSSSIFAANKMVGLQNAGNTLQIQICCKSDTSDKFKVQNAASTYERETFVPQARKK